jgi:hypothetical protein
MAEQFAWIVLGNDFQNGNKKMRSRIRSHAMRKTGALRKNSGIWGQRNLRQYPVLHVAATTSTASSISETTSGRSSGDTNGPEIEVREYTSSPSDDALAFEPWLGRPMPLSGLDQLTAEIGVNVLDLSALTTIQIGQKATSFLTKRPNHLVDLVGRRRLSYLTHVPGRYGRTSCLDDALRCVATKACRVLAGPGKGECTRELASYGKALHSLQSAVDHEEGWRNPDVLCAVQVLSLYEVCSSVPAPHGPALNTTYYRFLSAQLLVHGHIMYQQHLALSTQEGI